MTCVLPEQAVTSWSFGFGIQRRLQYWRKSVAHTQYFQAQNSDTSLAEFIKYKSTLTYSKHLKGSVGSWDPHGQEKVITSSRGSVGGPLLDRKIVLF